VDSAVVPGVARMPPRGSTTPVQAAKFSLARATAGDGP